MSSMVASIVACSPTVSDAWPSAMPASSSMDWYPPEMPAASVFDAERLRHVEHVRAVGSPLPRATGRAYAVLIDAAIAICGVYGPFSAGSLSVVVPAADQPDAPGGRGGQPGTAFGSLVRRDATALL